MSKRTSSLTLRHYQKQAVLANRLDSSDLDIPLIGLFGETGSLISEIKKKLRDKTAYLGYQASVLEELGDVLWYLTIIADARGILIADVALLSLKGISRTRHRSNINFATLQNNNASSKKKAAKGKPTKAFERTALRLAGDVGSLTTAFRSDNMKDNESALSGYLVTVMRSLVRAATDAGVSLEQAALRNLEKIDDRWPKKKNYPPLFDIKFQEGEQLPRELTIDIFERKIQQRVYVFQRCRGIFIGDRLTDNNMKPDDYRFHDVFHYAHAAVLGWSPVVRALFQLKRKSDSLIDENQDGARAILIEEGITTWIFGQAKKLNFFENIKPGELNFDLLKVIRQFVANYEPEDCPFWLWEDAILQGYAAFRFLRKHRAGKITIDMHRRKLSIARV